MGSTLAAEYTAQVGVTGEAARLLSETWKSQASNFFNFGGLIGALAAIPLARVMGRRTMFISYFLYSALLLFITFGVDWSPVVRLRLLFAVGMGVYGVFSAFVFYLPELFRTRVRATGQGFGYNFGRVLAAIGALQTGNLIGLFHKDWTIGELTIRNGLPAACSVLSVGR